MVQPPRLRTDETCYAGIKARGLDAVRRHTMLDDVVRL